MILNNQAVKIKAEPQKKGVNMKHMDKYLLEIHLSHQVPREPSADQRYILLEVPEK